MDVDTISKKSFSSLLDNKCVLGVQGTPQGSVEGLCDSVVLAEKGSEFIEQWLLSYQTHRSKGRDEYWAEHAVHMPYLLSRQFPHLIHVEPYSSFHYPLYHSAEPVASAVGIKLLFEQDLDFKEAYCHHLWETVSWEPYLRELTPDTIRNTNTTYTRIARQFLPA